MDKVERVQRDAYKLPTAEATPEQPQQGGGERDMAQHTAMCNFSIHHKDPLQQSHSKCKHSKSKRHIQQPHQQPTSIIDIGSRIIRIRRSDLDTDQQYTIYAMQIHMRNIELTDLGMEERKTLKDGLRRFTADANDLDEEQLTTSLRSGSIIAEAEVTRPEGEDVPDAPRPRAVTRLVGDIIGEDVNAPRVGRMETLQDRAHGPRGGEPGELGGGTLLPRLIF